MDFEYLVLGCGGAGIMAHIGFIDKLIESKKFNHNNIKEIHGVSAGSIAGILLILSKFNMQILTEYFIHRPWEKLLYLNAEDFLNTFKDQGYIGTDFFKEIVLQFLIMNNYDENLTFKQLHNDTNINLYLYSSNIKSDIPKSIILSHETYPDLPIVKALHMSCSYPLLFKPVYFENYCLVDGGLTCALPIPEKAFIDCPDKILALELPASDEKSNNSENSGYSELSQDDNIIKYILQLFSSCKAIIFNNSKQLNIKNKVVIKCNNSLSNWFKSINSKEIRENYIKSGQESAELFIKNYFNPE